jgi:hypothetical protein
MACAHAIASRAEQLAIDGRAAVRADSAAQRFVQLTRLLAKRRVSQPLRQGRRVRDVREQDDRGAGGECTGSLARGRLIEKRSQRASERQETSVFDRDETRARDKRSHGYSGSTPVHRRPRMI